MFTLKSDKPLFVLDIANNHNSSVEHGLRIIRECYEVVREFPYQFAVKLQYRHLDSFIHPSYKDKMDFKYVKRFTETKLSDDDYKILKDEMTNLGFITICTPFDEYSVDLIEKQGFDTIKVASCSFTDWSLLEKIAKTDKPIILSTAGASLKDIERVVSFLEHRNRDFALMHCVAEYPTPENHYQLNQIDLLKNHFPNVRIGLSTHEIPDEIYSTKIAIAKGATIFEKHVGMGNNLNAYSANPFDVLSWLISAKSAFEMCGVKNERIICDTKDLYALRRGVFVNRGIKQGEQIRQEDIFLAIPTFDNQVYANDLSKYTEFTAGCDIKKNEALLNSSVRKTDTREYLYAIINEVRKLVTQSGVSIPNKVDCEVSHHYGINGFKDYGCTIFTFVNREYCKKLIILLAGQKHPEQFHKEKEETFNILYGDLSIKLTDHQRLLKDKTVIADTENHELKVGDIITVKRGVKHEFSTKNGCVIEEISSTHIKSDSFYTDETIGRNNNRKTHIDYWS